MTKKIDTDPDGYSSKLFISSLDKCFTLLEALRVAGRPLGLTELVRLSGLNRSVTQRIAHTLKTLGYLNQDPENRAYTLSSRLLSFSHAVLSLDRVREKANPHLEALNRETGETVNLMRLEAEEIVYISRFPSKHAVSVDLHVGSRLPAFCTAAGRAILSRLDPEKALEILERSERKPMTSRTVTDLQGLRDALIAARKLGYALNNQEAFVGDISIAAPLIDRTNQPLGAVNIAVPSPRWNLEDAKRVLAPQVVETARTINSLVGNL